MSRYIPEGTRVAIRSLKPNSPAKWYYVKDRVNVPDGPLPEVACPMGTGNSVFRIEHMGFQVFFTNACLRQREETGVSEEQAKNLRLRLLDYDVPDNAVGRELKDGTKFQHPSSWLNKYAIRTTESAWVIPEGNLPYYELARIREVGGKWYSKKFDPSEASGLIEDCVSALKAEIGTMLASAETSRQTAEEKLEATPADEDPNAAQKKFLATASGIKSRHEKRLKNLKEAVGRFGISTLSAAFEKASTSLDALKASMENRARLYVKAVEAAKATGTAEGQAVAKSLQDNTIPPEVAADYLQEHGEEQTAEALRTAFGAGVQEDDTYSLTDEK